MRHSALILAALLATVIAGSSSAQSPAPAKTTDTAKGKTLVNASGMTLYTFDKDTAGKSACNGACAKIWPPFLSASDASASGDWSLITRADGSRQWAYMGKPLYTWVKDKKPGDTMGDGVKNVWHAAHP